MSADLSLKYIPIRDVPDILPRKNGKKTAVSTIYRWLDGLRGIRLRSEQIGGTRCTTHAWLAEFFSALSAQAGLGKAVPPIDTTARQAEIDRASARVKALTS